MLATPPRVMYVHLLIYPYDLGQTFASVLAFSCCHLASKDYCASDAKREVITKDEGYHTKGSSSSHGCKAWKMVFL